MNRSNEDLHIIFGAGLIGGFIAGGLLNAGYKAALVARPKTQAAMANGLRLTDFLDNTSTTRAPTFVNSSNSVQPKATFLWLTVKCTAVAGVVDELANFVDSDTTIICCQNGFGSDAPIRQRFTSNTVLGAVIGYNVAEPKLGHLHRSTEGKLVVEESPGIAQLINRLHTPLFPCAVSDDFLADKWAKLQLNLANPVNALADIPIKSMLEQRGYRRIIAQLQSELLEVTNAQQLQLPKLTALPPSWLPNMLDVPDFVFRLLGQKMLTIDPTARTSMWWDIHNHRQTEIDFLNQAVVDVASRVGVAAPLNQAIVGLVHQVEKGELEAGLSAAQMWQALNSA